MCYGAAGPGAGAFVVIAEAIKASGVIVRVEQDDFLTILSRMENPLVIAAQGGVFKKNYQYLTSYKGLGFFTKLPAPLELGQNVELVAAGKIYVPEF